MTIEVKTTGAETRKCVDHKASICGFCVDPDHQGEKIGTKLLESFLVDAKNDKKLRNIRLIAAVSSEAALQLISKFGFEKYGLDRDGIRDGTTYSDQVYMQISDV